MAIRIPFRAVYLVNWDSVNFALGVEAFDLAHHQPHPPGYLGYVALGRLVDWFVGDPVIALTAISIVSGAAATAGMYVLASRFGGERMALIAAILFGTSPLVWYYSEVALTYVVEVALAIPFVLLVMGARDRRSPRLLLGATVVLALIGALRQTGLVLFLPLWVYAWLAFSWRPRLVSGALLAFLVGAWMVPLLILSGGIGSYLRLSADLAALTGGATWLGAGVGAVQNVAIVSMGLILGLHVALLALPLSLSARHRPAPLTRDRRRLMIAWVIPPIVVYIVLHTGQLGYVLVLLPAGMIWAARRFDRWIESSRRAIAVAGLLVAVNVAGFVVLPEVAYAGVTSGRIELPEWAAEQALFEKGIRQASLSRSDAHWETLLEEIGEFDPATTAIIAEPRDGGSFRHITFYLPEYLVFGVGIDRDGNLGHLFTGFDHSIDYSVRKLDRASTELRLPEEIERVVITDPRLQERFEGALEMKGIELATGQEIATAEVEERSSVFFIGDDGHPIVASWDRSDIIERNLLPSLVAWDDACDAPDEHLIRAITGTRRC